MSDPDAPWRFRSSQATPNKEEQARLDKLAAETARVNELLRQVKRENAAAEAAAQTLSGRYWFLPSPVHAIQYRLRNSALPNSLVVVRLPRVAPWIEEEPGAGRSVVDE